MGLKEVVELVEGSDVYSAFKKEHEKAYLAHIFLMEDKERPGVHQVGYFDLGSDKITTFEVEGESVKLLGTEEVFKKEDDKIKELDISKVKVSPEEALEKARALQQEKYKANVPIKLFFIVQHLVTGQVYNITFISQSFNTLNIRIDTETGEVVEEGVTSLVDMERGK